MIYASKVIIIQHYYGNITDSNHGNGIQPNKDFKAFNKHRVNDHLLTLFYLYAGPNFTLTDYL